MNLPSEHIINSSCNLQKSCCHMMYHYEGCIHLSGQSGSCSSQMHLCTLNVKKCWISHQNDRCANSLATIRLILHCDARNPLGHIYSFCAELSFQIPRTYAQAACCFYDASIHLIRSRQSGPNTHQICAQIFLEEICSYPGCHTKHCCVQSLPIYPHLSAELRDKSVDKHYSDESV